MPRREDGHLSVLIALQQHPEGLTVADLMRITKKSERVVQRYLARVRERVDCSYRGLAKVWTLKGANSESQ